MEETPLQIFLQLATGAAGGIAVGMLFNALSIGRVANPIIGAVGGAVGCIALVTFGWAGVHPISDLASSTLGGAILVLAIGTAIKAIHRI